MCHARHALPSRSEPERGGIIKSGVSTREEVCATTRPRPPQHPLSSERGGITNPDVNPGDVVVCSDSVILTTTPEPRKRRHHIGRVNPIGNHQSPHANLKSP